MMPLDWLVLLVYLAVVTATGMTCGKGQKRALTYFLGDRRVHWLPAGITMTAVSVSTITFIGMPGQSFRSDWTFLQIYMVIPIAAWIVCRFFLPVYLRNNVMTAYEYLERRFSLRTRLLASALFQLILCGSTGVVLYAPSIMLAEMTGFSVLASLLIVGIVTTAYTMIGGVKGVIYTDILQTVVFLGGWMFAVLFIVNALPGGLGHAVSVAGSMGKLKLFDFSPDPARPATVWAGLVAMMFTHVALNGINQAQVQKYLTVSTLRGGQRAILFHGYSLLAIYVCFFALGTLLFVYYHDRPGSLPGNIDADHVFPYFIVRELPAGLRGFLIAGAFSAAMSTLSAALNALSNVTVSDFLDRLRPGNTLFRAKLLTAIWGIVVLGSGILAWRLGSILQTIVKVNSYFYGCLLGVFLLGMSTRRAGSRGAVSGLLAAVAVVMGLAFWAPQYWIWFGAIGCVVCVSVGYLASPKRVNELRFDPAECERN
jgi:SSS family solute:Na+ symporter